MEMLQYFRKKHTNVIRSLYTQSRCTTAVYNG